MSDRCFDVIVVGAGPAGSYTAYELASAGHDVAVFEAKSAPGADVCCTGIISTKCFELLDPGPDVVLHEATSASLFSPSGRRLRMETEQTQAYVVDRRLLDQAIASRARSCGARYFLSSPVVDIVSDGDGVRVEVLGCGVREVFRARAVVLANGFWPGLSRKLGLGKTRRYLVGAQAEVEAHDIDEPEVYLGQQLAPGSFAWLVPCSTGRAYAGVLAPSQAGALLRRFLGNLSDRGRIASRKVEIRQKPIPIGAIDRSYGDRLLVVGDAAGQVKPITGGGIYFGHLGARMAAGVLDEALRSDDLSAARLANYQKLWKARIGGEIFRGCWARRAYALLSDRNIERIFSTLIASGAAEALLRSNDFSFDWHSKAVVTLLRRGSAYPLLKMKELVSGEVGP